MSGILLTPYQGAILGPIAKVLGFILNGIFNVVPNVGVSIILFTVVIYIILIPLTYQQQKFSKLSAKMNPELQAIQAKYKNRKDQDSMAKQNEEMQIVYKKYGVSPTGSCVQLIIQMPILFALYRVINSIPAYVTKVYECLSSLAENILSTPKGIEVLSSLNITTKGEYAKYVTDGIFSSNQAVSAVIDVLNRASNAEWNTIGSIAGIDKGIFDTVRTQFEGFNNFLGLNVAYSPLNTIREAFADKNYILIVGALMVPLFAALTQWLNTLFMPQPSTPDGSNSAQSMMKSMTLTMPIMSAFFCFSLPIGLGIYWIAGAVIRSIEQIVINRQIDKMNIDKLIEKNMEKYNIKKASSTDKSKNSISTTAGKRTSTISAMAHKSMLSDKEKEEAYNKAVSLQKSNAKVGGIAAKANKVRDYNDRNRKN